MSLLKQSKAHVLAGKTEYRFGVDKLQIRNTDEYVMQINKYNVHIKWESFHENKLFYLFGLISEKHQQRCDRM